jgi:hypothetical protein
MMPFVKPRAPSVLIKSLIASRYFKKTSRFIYARVFNKSIGLYTINDALYRFIKRYLNLPTSDASGNKAFLLLSKSRVTHFVYYYFIYCEQSAIKNVSYNYDLRNSVWQSPD